MKWVKWFATQLVVELLLDAMLPLALLAAVHFGWMTLSTATIVIATLAYMSAERTNRKLRARITDLEEMLR